MRFETNQVLEIVGISKDTLRTWKRHLAPIAAIDGRVGKYTFGQLLALFVIARASQDIGVPISRFQAYAESIFEAMEQQLLPDANPRVLVVIKDTMFFVDEAAVSLEDTAAAFVSVRRARLAIVNGLNEVAPRPPEAQLELPLDGAKIVGLPGLKVAPNR